MPRELVSMTGTMADLLRKGNRFPPVSAKMEQSLHGVQSSASTSTMFDGDGTGDAEKSAGESVTSSAVATTMGGKRTDSSAPSRLKPMHNLPGLFQSVSSTPLVAV